MDLQLRQLLPLYFTREQVALSEIWLRDPIIKAGELIEIVAPSGSGKTSLIHFLYGMRNDYAGSILYDNRPLRDAGHEALAFYRKDKISVVFQDMRLFNSQSAFRNIEIKRQLNPFHEAKMIHEMCSRLGIGEKVNAICGNCSYGEQQRISIIRALMQPFEILLLDEPFSHLDKKNAVKAMELILEEVDKRKATIIFADLERTEFFPETRLLHL